MGKYINDYTFYACIVLKVPYRNITSAENVLKNLFFYAGPIVPMTHALNSRDIRNVTRNYPDNLLFKHCSTFLHSFMHVCHLRGNFCIPTANREVCLMSSYWFTAKIKFLIVVLFVSSELSFRSGNKKVAGDKIWAVWRLGQWLVLVGGDELCCRWERTLPNKRRKEGHFRVILGRNFRIRFSPNTYLVWMLKPLYIHVHTSHCKKITDL